MSRNRMFSRTVDDAFRGASYASPIETPRHVRTSVGKPIPTSPTLFQRISRTARNLFTRSAT